MEPFTIPTAVYDFIEKIKSETKHHNEKWGAVFENVFSNTLKTTVKPINGDETFLLTGDIPAMWLRDSTAQIRPFLVLAKHDETIRNMIKGLIKLQIRYIIHDPYANAFNETFNGHGHQDDATQMSDLIWERKYEIDSLCYPIQLAYLYFKNTGDDSVFDETFKKASKIILDLWKVEQHHVNSPYTFERNTDRFEDTLSHDGRGSDVAYTGMTWSGFRPSDDACIYHYLVPSNMFAVVACSYIEEIAMHHFNDENLKLQAKGLKEEIESGIRKHGVIETEFGSIFAYEVDGLGNYVLFDDPNVPSLLSAPYLGYCDEFDEIYQNTRHFILSENNKYFYQGQRAQGCGSSHTPENYIWPIALSIEGLTTSDKTRKALLLDTLVNNDGGTMMMHESFDVNDANNYTREWFSWANMMYCELLMDFLDIRVER